jgi:hypothetical protein
LAQDALDFSTVGAGVLLDSELQSVDGVDDVVAVLKVFDALKDDLHLDKFDTIQITRGAVVLLRVVSTSTCSGVGVSVEVNVYRRRLQQVQIDLLPSKSTIFASVVVAGMLAAAVLVFARGVYQP